MQPTAALVWDTIQKDPKFVAETPEGSPLRDAIRPFVEGSVVALAAQFDTVVTLQSLADAKVTFLHYCLDNNIGRALSNTLGAPEGMITGMLENMVESFAQVVSDMNAFLDKHGLTEAEVMAGPQIGFNETCKQKWQDGTLTIGELLALQPAVIVQNTN